MRSQILEIISRYVPSLTIQDALSMAGEIDRTAESVPVSNRGVPEITRIAVWAERNFSADDKYNRKIRCIKVLRERFGIGLKDSKDVMDNIYGSARESYHA